MKYRIPLFLFLAAALVAGAWMLVRPPELPEYASAPVKMESTPEDRARAAIPETKLGAASVLSIDPRTAAPKGRPTPAARATLFGEYLAAKSYKALYDRLKANGDAQTPEAWYMMYEILRRCATVTERTARQPARPADQKRDDFVAALSPTDPMREKRIAAFDDVTANRCTGMEGITITQADLNKMLANAASGGDPKAQALSLEQELWAARRAAGPEGRWGRDSVTLSDAQVGNLQRIAASRDPEAMLIAGRMLSTSWHDLTLRVGPDNQPVEQRAFMQAWALLACDYGYPCGDTNPRVQSACAYQGHCNAASLSDYLYYYGASPNDSQLMTQYRAILQNAITTGDWSQVNAARGPRPPGTQPTFGFLGWGPGGR
ncbi:MAG: hypothetical protein ABI789_03705 [Usitatibacter sp.]